MLDPGSCYEWHDVSLDVYFLLYFCLKNFNERMAFGGRIMADHDMTRL